VTNWDQRFLDLAQHVAGWSKDSTKVGAVITRGKFVVGLGFNGFPAGIADDERLLDRPTKLEIVIHAEQNAVLSAKQNLDGCTIYVWPFLPCTNCASVVIQSGIKRVVAASAERFTESLPLLDEAGVHVIWRVKNESAL
jgi:dCMP deaminase